MDSVFTTVEHEVELCVVGGGMSGYGVALAAANHGVKVLLMHDRPMLGGNASSEVRMHICGADCHNSNKDLRETGLMEELRLKNVYRNPSESYAIWDGLMYEDIKFHPNITLLLNCSCLDAQTENGQIVSVTGWQIQSEKYHTVKAKWFADCSGDGILAPLTGAEFRIGCEGKDEFNEALAPDVANDDTMGNTLMFSVKDCGKPTEFIAPEWAHKFPKCEDLPYGLGGHGHGWQNGKVGYWWLEVGGKQDSIADNEDIRDELMKIVYGVWDHLKNHCERKAAVENFAIDWMAMLPAKRENRRYIGDYILNENDLEAGTNFDDDVAYGGWTMDTHDPEGFWAVKSGKAATHFNKCCPGYGIPWRSLYSKNISNLLFAGRNISATHMAMSSTRVMATCLIMGQAVGTGVGVMKKNGLATPDQVGAHINELQQLLLRDDAYIPKVAMQPSEAGRKAALGASVAADNLEALRDGFSRVVGEDKHGVDYVEGSSFEYELSAAKVNQVFIAFDSELNVDNALTNIGMRGYAMPQSMPKEFVVEYKQGGEWKELVKEETNIRRHHLLDLGCEVEGVRLKVGKFWGNAESSHLFSFVLL